MATHGEEFARRPRLCKAGAGPHPGILGFPIRIANRDLVRRTFAEEGIYSPVHRPMPESAPDALCGGKWLVPGIMTPPRDRRYDAADSRRTASRIQRICA